MSLASSSKTKMDAVISDARLMPLVLPELDISIESAMAQLVKANFTISPDKAAQVTLKVKDLAEDAIIPDDGPDTTEAGTKRKSNAKRPPNKFIVFRTVFVRRLRDHIFRDDEGSEGRLKIGLKSKLASAYWKHMSDEAQRPWAAAGQRMKKEHEAMYPDYAYKPERKSEKEGEKKRKGGSSSSSQTDSDTTTDDLPRQMRRKVATPAPQVPHPGGDATRAGHSPSQVAVRPTPSRNDHIFLWFQAQRQLSVEQIRNINFSEHSRVQGDIQADAARLRGEAVDSTDKLDASDFTAPEDFQFGSSDLSGDGQQYGADWNFY